MKRLKRHSNFTSFSKRLTPVEVAQFWFRRATMFAREIHECHPDFPAPGPDGLYLLSDVERWFDRWHGHPRDERPRAAEEARLLQIARYGRRE